MKQFFINLIDWVNSVFAENMTPNEPIAPTQGPVVPNATIPALESTTEPLIASVAPLSANKPLIPQIPEKFLHAIVMQESSGNVGAIGDLKLKEHAYGPMQIRQPVCDDVNNRFKSSLKSEQMLNNLELSQDTFTKYMSIYFPIGGTFEEMSRCWNAGPNWKNEMKATNGYWEGVQKYL